MSQPSSLCILVLSLILIMTPWSFSAPAESHSSSTLITSIETQAFLKTLLPTLSASMESISNNITSSLLSHSFNNAHVLEKRSFHNLKSSVHSYLQKKFVDPLLESYQPLLENKLQLGIQEFQQWKTIENRKRSLSGSDVAPPSTINKKEEEEKAKAFAEKLSKSLSEDFKEHALLQYMKFLHGHHQSASQTTPKTETIASDTSSSPSEKHSKLTKRALLNRTNKNEAIYNIVRNFLMIPFFFTTAAFGIGGMIAVTLWDMLFVGPVFHKLLFGTFF